jgi:hypothetical protein
MNSMMNMAAIVFEVLFCDRSLKKYANFINDTVMKIEINDMAAP